jgi:streptomycin 6-kinase
MSDLTIPGALAAASTVPERASWLRRLPLLVAEVVRTWSLELGPPFEPGGHTAWVAPARRSSDELVLKVAWRHTEGEHEADALRAWDGDGAVRVVESEARADAVVLLLERCDPGVPLRVLPEAEHHEVVAALLRRLWRRPAPGHPFRPLHEMCEQWAEEYERKVEAGRGVVDPGLGRDAMELFRSLAGDPVEPVLLCTDLHAGNVLSARREPWLVIDPKPYVGDPTYDVLQHLLNCERLHEEPETLVSRVADLAQLDAERVRLWLFARCVQESPDWPGLGDVGRRISPR